MNKNIILRGDLHSHIEVVSERFTVEIKVQNSLNIWDIKKEKNCCKTLSVCYLDWKSDLNNYKTCRDRKWLQTLLKTISFEKETTELYRSKKWIFKSFKIDLDHELTGSLTGVIAWTDQASFARL